MKQEIKERIEKIRKGEVPEGYRKTKVGIIPRDWEVKTLDAIADIDPDNLSNSTNPEYSFQYISLEDVDYGTLMNTTELQFKDAPSRARRKIRKDDILLSTVRPNLKSHLLIRKEISNWICSTGFSVLRCKDNIAHSGFVFNHLFSSVIDRQIETLITGSNYPAINSKDVKSLQIPFSPLPEQEKIAEILSTWEKAIDLKEKLIEEKKEFKKGLMQKLLTGEIRFSEFNDEWKNIKLKNLVSKMQSGGTPKTSEVKYYNGKIPFVKVNDITVAGKYLRKTTTNINEEGLKNSSSWLVPVNSILYSMYASVGFLCINKIPVATSQAIINILPNNNVDLEYLYYFLLNHKTKISRLIETGTQGNINAGIVRDIQVNLPSFEEQKKISLTLSNQDREIELLEKEVFQLKNEKKGLMQMLLTGSVRVNI